jgi:hypothetical protein
VTPDAPTVATPPVSYWAGLDLGQSRDYTAFAVLERTERPPPPPPVRVLDTAAMGRLTITEPAALKRLFAERPRTANRYTLRHLERFDLGTRYDAIVERVTTLFSRPPLAGGTLAVDATGVGRPVVDLFVRTAGAGLACPACRGREPRTDDFTMLAYAEAIACPTCGGSGKVRLKGSVRPITITAGSAVTPDGPGWRVAKKELVGALQVFIQSRRLLYSLDMPLVAELMKELETFKVKVKAATGNESLESWRETDHDDIVLAVALALWTAERGSQQFWLR